MKRMFALMEQKQNKKYRQGDIILRGVFEGIVIMANENSYIIDCFQSTINELLDKHHNNKMKIVYKYKNVWFTD